MDEALIFDRIELISVTPRGWLSPGTERQFFDVLVRHVIDGIEVDRATLSAYMTDSAILAAQTPVHLYVGRHVEWLGNALANDGRKLETLRQRAQDEGGSLSIPRPADEQDYARPLRTA